ncbi:serine hydrolase [Roseomonas sp. 18066]|uniref:serine hydrolase domain-containing protein n=1 Tax=Roseomonas sp. 18066 TaxID=2681412 RepID=UPI001F35F5FB|nr:serine hydrolase [Roseomonas sp. 18066]
MILSDTGSWDHWKNPAEAGWDAGQLARAVEDSRTLDTAALMVVVRGRVLLAEGAVDARYNVHSIRKSFLSAQIGMHEAEGRIDLEATLDSLGIDDKLGLTPREKLATVLDLLCARSGVYHPSGYESPWMIAIKPARHSAGPGTTWCYNNWDFNALGTIFRKLTGADIFADFAARIAAPCGMQDFRPEQDGEYIDLPDSAHPAYPFRMTARDLARFGQLFLDGGRGIVPRSWVQQSVLPISEAGTRGAYGFMWWVARAGILFPHALMPAGSYAALGTRGHVLLVIPALQAVIVHRVDTDQPSTSVSHTRLGRLLAHLLSAAPPA